MLPAWDPTLNLKTWWGYKDNVLLSREHAIGSAFAAGGIDLLLWRLPRNGWEVILLGSGEYVRYFSADEVDKEVTTLAQAQVKREFRRGWKLTLSAEHVYFDQVFDNSQFDGTFNSVQVQGHTLALRPTLRREFENRFFAEAEFALARQQFAGVVDDEWQGSGKFSLGRNFGHGSEAVAGCQFLDRQFDTRLARTALGEALPGSLEFFQHEGFLAWRQNWDADRRWRTVTRLSLLRTEDNGGGYYDYWRPRVSQQLRYVAASWQLRAEARLSWYEYEAQSVDFEGLELRRKTLLQLILRGEKNLTRRLKLFGQYEHERSRSNLTIESYRANAVFAGLDWEF